MNCDICNGNTVRCIKCDFDICTTCNDSLLFCEIEDGYICNICYYLYDIKFFKCNQCNVTCCTDCRSCYNCYLMLCENCIKDKTCSSCTYEFQYSACVDWYNSVFCSCCLCLNLDYPCEQCEMSNITQCENILQCICKKCFVCHNTGKFICEDCVKICKECHSSFNINHIGDRCYTCKFKLIKTTHNNITKTFPKEIVDTICNS